MTEAEKILNMIENVNPDDIETLNEIDAMVFVYLNFSERYFKEVHYKGNRVCWKTIMDYYSNKIVKIQYTRSRDVLKSIRPKGWKVCITSNGRCQMWKDECEAPNITSYNNQKGKLPTEELAELHAIIQAIEWERNNVKR